jgi:hypothetical protein
MREFEVLEFALAGETRCPSLEFAFTTQSVRYVNANPRPRLRENKRLLRSLHDSMLRGLSEL